MIIPIKIMLHIRLWQLNFSGGTPGRNMDIVDSNISKRTSISYLRQDKFLLLSSRELHWWLRSWGRVSNEG